MDSQVLPWNMENDDVTQERLKVLLSDSCKIGVLFNTYQCVSVVCPSGNMFASAHSFYAVFTHVFSLLQTRLFVTNQIQHLEFVNEIIVLDHGRISARGSFDELKKNNDAFASFLETHLKDKESDAVTDSQSDVSENMKSEIRANLETSGKQRRRARKSTVRSDISEVKSDTKHKTVTKNILHEDEDMHKGSVGTLLLKKLMLSPHNVLLLISMMSLNFHDVLDLAK